MRIRAQSIWRSTAQIPSIDDEGNLVLRVGHDEVRFEKPVVYQQTDGHAAGRHSVDGRYRLTADSKVTFQLGAYDKSRSLVIDPVLVYSTYLEGTSSDGAYRVFVDSSGSAYVTGGVEPVISPLRPALSRQHSVVSAQAAPKNPSFNAATHSSLR